MENKQTVTVIGAGLAGSEAAWQIAQAGYPVRLFEMKPQKFSPAHKSAGFAELICSNSLKAARIDSAAGLLKEEMRRMGSLLVACADASRVPAGGALAVDRTLFSEYITAKINSQPQITVLRGLKAQQIGMDLRDDEALFQYLAIKDLYVDVVQGYMLQLAFRNEVNDGGL